MSRSNRRNRAVSVANYATLAAGSGDHRDDHHVDHDDNDDDGRPRLTHVDRRTGDARMVDVSRKQDTRRVATAAADVRLDDVATRLIAEDACNKGDVLAVARLAGTTAAKLTWQLIPLCHQVRLDTVTVDARLDVNKRRVRITATAIGTDRTGVEMECLTACAVAALTVYDMCKAVSRCTVVERVRLLSKTGGKNDYYAPDDDETSD